jgi:hypothetical protein
MDVGVEDVATKEPTETAGLVALALPAVVPEKTANTKYCVTGASTSPVNDLPNVSSNWVAVPSGIAPLVVLIVLYDIEYNTL